MSAAAKRIAENLVQIRQRIAEAAARSGRSAADVTLVAATKYVSAEVARDVFDAGCSDLGESRPQDLWAKGALLSELPIRWHLIGHLQRNKVRRTLPLTSWIHSGDSQRLLTALNDVAGELSLRPRLLIEVNISGDANKHGFRPNELEPLLAEFALLPHLDIRGLMGMARLEGGREEARRDFAAMRELRDRLAPLCPDSISLFELSMGMSDDYDIAIEEGATIVRVGSAIYDGL